MLRVRSTPFGGDGLGDESSLQIPHVRLREILVLTHKEGESIPKVLRRILIVGQDSLQDIIAFADIDGGSARELGVIANQHINASTPTLISLAEGGQSCP